MKKRSLFIYLLVLVASVCMVACGTPTTDKESTSGENPGVQQDAGASEQVEEKKEEPKATPDAGESQTPEKETEPLPESQPEPHPEVQPEKQPPLPPPAKTLVYYYVVVRGKLKGGADKAKLVHNQIVKAGKDAAMKLGDMSHHVYLNTKDTNEFLAIDVWDSKEGLDKYFKDPNVQKAFGQLFEGQPKIGVWKRRPGWRQYWENDVSGKPHLRVMVEATLKEGEEAAKKRHNQIVTGALSAKPSVRELGDLVHYVYQNPKSPKAFLAFDVWNNPKGLDAYFKNPEVGKSFGQLFSAPPNISVWKKAEGWTAYDTTLYTVTVVGKLKGDPNDAKKIHNEIVGKFSGVARGMGDLSHHVFTDPKDPTAFLAIDVWKDAAGMNKYLQDPNVQKELGRLFTAPPSISVSIHRQGWKQYGENDVSGKAHLRVMVQGKLKEAEEAAKKFHNQIVAGALSAKPSVRDLGDLVHEVYTNPKEAKDFLAFDVWNDPKGLDGYFKDPNVQKAFGQLFSAPPKLTVWKKAEGWTAY